MPQMECTKRDAIFCPLHGFCECRSRAARVTDNRDRCHLHAHWSDHGAEDVQTVWGTIRVPPTRVSA